MIVNKLIKTVHQMDQQDVQTYKMHAVVINYKFLVLLQKVVNIVNGTNLNVKMKLVKLQKG